MPDHESWVMDVSSQDPLHAIFIGAFLLLAPLTLMGMLAGVLVEVVSVVASIEKEQMCVQYVSTMLKIWLLSSEEEWHDDEANLDNVGLEKHDILDLMAR